MFVFKLQVPGVSISVSLQMLPRNQVEVGAFVGNPLPQPYESYACCFSSKLARTSSRGSRGSPVAAFYVATALGVSGRVEVNCGLPRSFYRVYRINLSWKSGTELGFCRFTCYQEDATCSLFDGEVCTSVRHLILQ